MRPISSLPWNRTLPSRRGTRPMIDFMVVVLPAPLRPSRVTTSPSRTSRSTPCRMWLSPYQAFSPLIASMSGMVTAKVGGDHLGVLGDRGVVAFGQDAPARQHRDGVTKPFDDGQIVLHHQNRPSIPHPPDQFDDTVHIAVCHACRRLIQQHHL